MRLLLRASSHHRSGAGDTQIAASPDTLHREAWQWDLRLHDTSGTPERQSSTAVALTRSDGSVSHLVLNADADVVTAAVELLDLDQSAEIERTADELVVFVVGSGSVLIEGRHVLGELDAMVLAGRDPSRVRVQQLSDPGPCVALVRLSPRGSGSLAWVP